MKTPWRFVADLVSRKPKPETAAVTPKTIALEYKPVPEEEHSNLEPAALDRSAEAGSDAQIEASLHDQNTGSTEVEPAAPVAAEAPAQQSDEEASAPLQTEAAETLVKPDLARRRKVKPIAEPSPSANQTDKLAPSVVVGPKSFTEEMAVLDAEVAALRRQLAQKLIEQNAQLRRMLARFDGR